MMDIYSAMEDDGTIEVIVGIDNHIRNEFAVDVTGSEIMFLLHLFVIVNCDDFIFCIGMIFTLIVMPCLVECHSCSDD